MAGLTAERLRELLSYDPETGVFTWVARPAQYILAGAVAGGVNNEGYWMIKIDGRTYSGHRLAWLWVKGEWPSSDIDHKNLDKSDNRFSELRLATESQNLANSKVRKDNTTGLKRVGWHKRDRVWYSNIQINGKQKYLGSFKCPAAAYFAYIIAADNAFGEFARVS